MATHHAIDAARSGTSAEGRGGQVPTEGTPARREQRAESSRSTGELLVPPGQEVPGGLVPAPFGKGELLPRHFRHRNVTPSSCRTTAPARRSPPPPRTR